MKQCCLIVWSAEKIHKVVRTPDLVRNKNGRIMLLSKCAVCDSK